MTQTILAELKNKFMWWWDQVMMCFIFSFLAHPPVYIHWGRSCNVHGIPGSSGPQKPWRLVRNQPGALDFSLTFSLDALLMSVSLASAAGIARTTQSPGTRWLRLNSTRCASHSLVWKNSHFVVIRLYFAHRSAALTLCAGCVPDATVRQGLFPESAQSKTLNLVNAGSRKLNLIKSSAGFDSSTCSSGDLITSRLVPNPSSSIKSYWKHLNSTFFPFTFCLF